MNTESMRRLTVCIGYDSREPLTLDVLAHSIIRRASKPVTILPIALNHLKGVYTRTDPAGTTEFSLTRFLTPYMCGYDGWGLFMDSDMLCLTDVYDVMARVPPEERDYDYTQEHAYTNGPIVYCCQHDYVPREAQKATGVQTAYPRKNWSSLMLFRNANARHGLTPDYVNAATPAQLHRFEWAGDRIGSLPLEWNWLVGEYPDNPNAKVLHYTLGAPCFPGYEDSPMAQVWWDEYRSMLQPMKTYALPQAEVFAKASGASR